MPAVAISTSLETRVSGRMNIHPHFHNFAGGFHLSTRKNEQLSDDGPKRHTEFYCSAHKRPNGLFKKVSSPFARQALAVYSPRR